MQRKITHFNYVGYAHYPVMTRPWPQDRGQGQGQGQNRTNKAYNADIAFSKWLLPVLRLTEVTMTGNSLRLAGKYWYGIS